jgi:hypothetical protein
VPGSINFELYVIGIQNKGSQYRNQPQLAVTVTPAVMSFGSRNRSAQSCIGVFGLTRKILAARSSCK